MPPPISPDSVLHRYYRCVNTRQFDEAASLISVDCEFSHTATREHTSGPRGFRALIDGWLQAAPDLTLTPESVTPLEPDLFSVRLSLRGHFHGDITFGPSVMSGEGKAFAIRGIHRVRIRDGQIVRSEFTFDPVDLARLV